MPTDGLDEGVTLAPLASSSQSALFPETVSPTQFSVGTLSPAATLSPGSTRVPTFDGERELCVCVCYAWIVPRPPSHPTPPFPVVILVC